MLSNSNLISQVAGSFCPMDPGEGKIPIKLKHKTIFDLIHTSFTEAITEQLKFNFLSSQGVPLKT